MKSQSRRGLRFGSLFLAMVLVLAACDSGESTDTTTGGTGGEASGEPVELLVWASRDWYAPPDNYDAFNERHEGEIHVTLDVQANDDILQQLQRMQDADQPMPDLVQDDTFLIEAYNAAGLVMPFDEQMATWEEEDPEEFANILPIAWEENVLDGQTLGSSLTANFDIFYYNVPWMEEAGVDPSTIDSLDGVLEALRAAKTARPDGIPLTVQALPTTGVTLFKTFLSAAGAPFEGATPKSNGAS